jgi:DNA adenine methylase
MDPPYWQTEGYGVDFPFEQYQEMAAFMQRCKGKVMAMVSINDHPDIRQAFAGFHMEQTGLKYSVSNQRQGAPATSSELVIMNWVPEVMAGLF